MVVVVGLTLWALSGPAPQVLKLRALSDEYARLTAGYKPDRSAYPLPKLEKGQAELAYLQAVNQRLATAGGDCLAAERDLRRLFENNQAERRGSIFQPAAQVLARREGQDFVQSSSDSIRGGAGFSLRPRLREQKTVNPDLAIQLLKEKMALADLVEQAGRRLTESIEAVEQFASECPDELPVIDRVLGYFLHLPSSS